jgi:hypothetical protein
MFFPSGLPYFWVCDKIPIAALAMPYHMADLPFSSYVLLSSLRYKNVFFQGNDRDFQGYVTSIEGGLKAIRLEEDGIRKTLVVNGCLRILWLRWMKIL